MASILRQIVASPRARHPEAKLDLCYVTDNIIATSGPSQSYPSLAYRNPLPSLTKFLDSKHGEQWSIWEFRAEGTGYNDEAVHNRIYHFPWPDHHPPPFGLIPNIVSTMQDWLHGEEEAAHKGKGGAAGDHRVVVVHCKAGKGRSGTAAISYLISQEGWEKQKALDRFTERRMRPGFGYGLSIPSQIRWVGYVERWTKLGGKRYLEQSVEITEVHVWGLRDGTKIAVEGFIDAGKRINNFHTFAKKERDDAVAPSTEDQLLGSARPGAPSRIASTKESQPLTTASTTEEPSPNVSAPPSNLQSFAGLKISATESSNTPGSSGRSGTTRNDKINGSGSASSSSNNEINDAAQASGVNVIFRPSKRVIVPTSDVNLAVERRTKGGYMPGIVTSIAHVWFNCYFEGQGPERYQAWREQLPLSESFGINDSTAIPEAAQPESSGVFSIAWDAMDGIKGSIRKGARAFDKVAIVWRIVPPSEQPAVQIELTPPLDAAAKDATTKKGQKTKKRDYLSPDQKGGLEGSVTLQGLVEGNRQGFASGSGGSSSTSGAGPGQTPLSGSTAATTTTTGLATQTAVAKDQQQPEQVPISDALQVDSDEELEGVKGTVSETPSDVDKDKETARGVEDVK